MRTVLFERILNTNGRNAMPYLCLIVVLAVMVPMGAVAEEYRTPTETVVVRTDDAAQIRFQDIARTTFSYTGEDGRDTLSIDWALTVESDDSRDFEEIADRIDVVTDSDGGRITVRLEHPRRMGTHGFFSSLFRNDLDWHVEMNVTGPSGTDLECDADFSEISFAGTNGILAIDADFGETTITDHIGALNAEVSFGDFECTALDGTFSLEAEFSEVSCDLARLAGDSRASASFGSVTLGFPAGTDADIRADSSFGDIKYRVDSAQDRSENGADNRVLGRGGPVVDLSASFGDIIIRTGDNVERSISTNDRDSMSILPITSSSSWQYSHDSDSMTLSVESIGTLGGWPTAVLACSDAPERPFDTIGIVARDDGLYLTSIEGRFFGHRLPPMRFDEPRLWLPYRVQAYVEGDDVVGTVTITEVDGIMDTSIITTGVMGTASGSLENVITYRIVMHDEDTWRIALAPGVGFAAIGPWELTGHNSGNARKPRDRQKEARPQFREGVVRSVSVRGDEVVSETEIRDRLGIEPGRRYTRAEIEEAVDALPRGHRIIEDATFRIEEDGALTVRVHERDLLDVDFEPMFSFNRVGGVGIGPRVEIESLLGPISLIEGGGEYHFASEEWTYAVRGEKVVGNNRFLTIGGSYRRGYESAMDWAIPDADTHVNAFLLGEATKNLHKVEGATASLTLARESLGVLKAEYFDEKFESVKKHTNWSLFDDDRKDNNPPLPALSEGRATGMRYSIELQRRTTGINTGLYLAWEQTWDSGADSIDDYTRVFGSLVTTWLTSPRQMMKLRLAGGWTPDVLPPQKDFRLGGLNTLRGYAYESVPLGNPRAFQQGGSRMFLANLEHCLRGNSDFGIILFADAGNVWLEGEDQEIADLRRDIGIGITFDTDIFMLGQAIPSFSAITSDDRGGLRVNWAIPVGPVPHDSLWTVNFVQGF
jgi:hypothetical protein